MEALTAFFSSNARGIDWSLLAGAESLPEPSEPSTPESEQSEIEASASARRRGARPAKGTETPSAQRMGEAQAVDKKVSKPVDKTDWLWAMTEEPHRSRRKAILAAHPEISKLMGCEPLTKYIVLAVVALQVSAAYALRNTHPGSWKFWLTAYIVGATANQNLFLAIHEITHNLAFRGIKANKAFAIFANLPIGLPYALLFKPYHIEHHKHLGEDGIDTDLPTRFELLCLSNVFGKAFFATFQILFYALRPGFVRAQKFSSWVAINFAVQFAFSYGVYSLFGGYSLLYLLISSLLAGSLHPCAAHFIAEHYVFESAYPDETFSYYGPLNLLTYNVGYHNEHHDFPSIPWTRLPALHRIAKEFYAPLPRHDSWVLVTLRFIFDGQIGLWSRVKRAPQYPKKELDAIEKAKRVREEGGQANFGGIMDS